MSEREIEGGEVEGRRERKREGEERKKKRKLVRAKKFWKEKTNNREERDKQTKTEKER